MAIADTRIEAASADDLAPLFEWYQRDRMPGVIVAPDPMFLAARTKIVSRTARGGLPAIYNLREFADIGGHLGYGPGIRDAYHREAPFADRTLECVNPGVRPDAQPTVLAPAIGVATATSLGITVPPSMMALADRVAP